MCPPRDGSKLPASTACRTHASAATSAAVVAASATEAADFLLMARIRGRIRQDLAYWSNVHIIRETEARPVSLHGRGSTTHRMVVPGEGATCAQ